MPLRANRTEKLTVLYIPKFNEQFIIYGKQKSAPWTKAIRALLI